MSTSVEVNGSNYNSFVTGDRVWGSETQLINALATNAGRDNTDAVFFGKHGSDTRSGATNAKAKLTIGDAITAANALTPAADNRIALVCQDGGQYSGDVSLPEYVDLIAPGITIVGQLTTNGSNYVSVGKVDGDTSAYAITSSTAGTAVIRVNELDEGTSGTVYNDAGTIVLNAGAVTGDIEAENSGTFIKYFIGDRVSGSDTETASGVVNGVDTALDTSAITAHIAATSGVHGATGTIVGTSDAQTLTNKTIDADNNTCSNFDHGAEVDNPTAAHGVGEIVGTTEAQTLTNKTLDDYNFSGDIYKGGAKWLHTDGGDDNLFIGLDSGTAIDVGGLRNLAIGNDALRQMTTGDDTVAIGWGAGEGCVTTRYSVIIGSQAGETNSPGNNGVIIGYKAGENCTAGKLGTGVIIGSGAGQNATGNKNVYIGYNVGQNGTGENTIAIGTNGACNAPAGSHFLVGREATRNLIDCTWASGGTYKTEWNGWLGIGDDNVGTLSAPTSMLDVQGSIAGEIVTKTTDYTATAQDFTIIADGSSGTVTITLPAASGCEGRIYNIKAVDITNTVDVDGDGAETIDGAATYTFNSQYESITIQSDGTEWWII